MKPVSALVVTLGAVAVATGVGIGLQAVVPTAALGFLMFVPPILVAALVGGLMPALVATVLGATLAEYFFYQPYFTLHWAGEDAYPLVLYILIGLGIAVLAGRLADARADVQRQSREFETLFRLTPVGIGVATDPDCQNISVNPAFAKMLRIEPSQNASLSALDPGDRLSFVVQKNGVPVPASDLPLQMAARLGTEVKNAELDVVHADGTVITLYEYAAPLFDDEGRVRGAVGAFLDITEIKQAEERLRRLAAENEQLYREAHEANRLKDEFLATLSHELRTPLNALMGWIQLLRSGQLTPEKRERALAAVERSADLQAKLTSDLLDVSGVVTGKLQLYPEPTLLGPIAEYVMESLRPAAQSKGVACTRHVSVEGALLLDSARVQQILTNLVANAIKFTPSGGTVHLDVRIDGGDVVMCVRDSGIGIAPAFLPYVFERFRQAESGVSRAFGGLGIGLSIVKQLAERHGGRVTAESAGENKGATFTVRIPVTSAARMDSDVAPLRWEGRSEARSEK